MLRRIRDAVLVSLITAASLSAQNQQSVPRAIRMPDTLGANFAVTDTLTATSGPADYDFLVGTWRFTFQSRRQDGTFAPAFSGHWVVSSKQTGNQGVLLEDHWRPDDATSTWDAGTWTYRAYNPQRKIWEMRGINTSLGAWQPGLMWRDGESRLLTEWYGNMLVRFRYFDIRPDRFLWRADATFNRGKSWIPDYWTMEVFRISR